MPADRDWSARIVAQLLDRHGRSFADELGLDLDAGGEEARFRWLCTALLLSAPIAAPVAMRAARALADAGWTTPRAMQESRWEDRVDVLNRAGYARYDERTARMLGEAATLLIDRFGGDLDNLRAAASGDLETARRRLKDFKGIGNVGADIFLREMQRAWPEFYPFADAKALSAAARLGLPDTAPRLAELVRPEDFPRLLAALVRADLAGEIDLIASTVEGLDDGG